MKEQLIQYVQLLFAGCTDAEDMKQEILQNTLDKFDDYVAQGRSEEAAYRLAISGIGDIGEILGRSEPSQQAQMQDEKTDYRGQPSKPLWKKILCAIGVFLCIVSVIPQLVLEELGMETLGTCGMFAIIAVAIPLFVIASGDSAPHASRAARRDKADEPLRKAVCRLIFVIGLAVYLLLSFATNAWYITWVIFPLAAAVWGIASAVFDLKGGNGNEA